MNIETKMSTNMKTSKYPPKKVRFVIHMSNQEHKRISNKNKKINAQNVRFIRHTVPPKQLKSTTTFNKNKHKRDKN